MKENIFEKAIDFVNKWGHVWFMKNHKKWNCALTLGGLDVNEFGETEEECKQYMVLKIVNSKYLKAALEKLTTPK